MKTRKAVADLAESWVGKKESDGSHKSIIDIYNSHSPLPRGLKMQYGWSWCACTWSALAISLGYTDIMPIEISCGYLIDAAKKKGIWVENDAYVPDVGDGVVYDWDDKGSGDCTGWPDHVGVVTYVNRESGYMVVTEGNYGDAVKKRTVSLNGKYIRGFITPKYDALRDPNHTQAADQQGGKDIKTVAHEVITGVWGSGDVRKTLLANAGYNYGEVQALVNQILNGDAVTTTNPVQDQNQPIGSKVTATCAAKRYDEMLYGVYTTTTDLYCRNDAGTNKKALCKIPKGTEVWCYGYYNLSGNTRWYYIQFTMDGVQYTGFSHKDCLKKQ